MQVYVVGQLGPAERQVLVEQCPGLEVLEDHGGEVPDAFDALLVWNVTDTARVGEILRARPGVRWVHLRSAGIPLAVLRALEGRPTILTNGSGAHGTAIAEFVLAVILAFYKRLDDLRQLQARAEWSTSFRVSELAGKTIGIVGLGDIGVSTARLLRPFGVRLLGMRRSAEPSTDVDEVFTLDALNLFLDRLDVLVLAAPLTTETKGLIGHEQLARLKRGAVLVNVARGALVDEEALAAALQSGQLGGAGLDVFRREPLPPTSPLWTTPNTIISPHASYITEGMPERRIELFAANVRRFADGRPLSNVVNRELGY